MGVTFPVILSYDFEDFAHFLIVNHSGQISLFLSNPKVIPVTFSDIKYFSPCKAAISQLVKATGAVYNIAAGVLYPVNGFIEANDRLPAN
ncbi:MAG: hypothetical protein JWP71_3429 [Mucilaginibacter sp.]|nr:hypothetical protein [Mucilaginibacter sp.]